MTAKFRAPIEVVRRPSAIVAGFGQVSIRPASSERLASSALAGSPAMTLVAGEMPSTASAVPASKPPPPTGQMTRSSGPASSSSSSAAVPCPAITFQSSNG